MKSNHDNAYSLHLGSFVPDTGKKILYVDVTHTWGTHWQTGVQRVVRQVVTNWYLLNRNIALIIFQDGEYKVLPQSALANFIVLYSERIPKKSKLKFYVFTFFLPIYLKLKVSMPKGGALILQNHPTLKVIRRFLTKLWVPEGTVSLDPLNAKIVLLDMVLNPIQIDYLKTISLQHGAELSYLSYDCNPLIAPQYWPKEISEDFSSYVSLVCFSTRVWSISRTAQDDIKKFSKADLEKVSFDFKWLPPFDFPECNHEVSLVVGLERDKYILMVASYVPSKNHLGFFEALKELKLKGVSIPKVYLVGGGSWIGSDIESKMMELSTIGIQVAKYEAVQNCCLGKFYQNCSFSILPSFIEGFGLPIVESLSYGKPVVTSTSTSMGELLALPGTIGFSHENSPNLTSILEQLISSNELLETLTAEANANRNNLGSWQEYALELYDFVMRDKA